MLEYRRIISRLSPVNNTTTLSTKRTLRHLRDSQVFFARKRKEQTKQIRIQQHRSPCNDDDDNNNFRVFGITVGGGGEFSYEQNMRFTRVTLRFAQLIIWGSDENWVVETKGFLNLLSLLVVAVILFEDVRGDRPESLNKLSLKLNDSFHTFYSNNIIHRDTLEVAFISSWQLANITGQYKEEEGEEERYLWVIYIQPIVRECELRRVLK